MMKENFFIKYKWTDLNNWEISLTSLWESIIWFDLIIKEILKTYFKTGYFLNDT